MRSSWQHTQYQWYHQVISSAGKLACITSVWPHQQVECINNFEEHVAEDVRIGWPCDAASLQHPQFRGRSPQRAMDAMVHKEPAWQVIDTGIISCWKCAAAQQVGTDTGTGNI